MSPVERSANSKQLSKLPTRSNLCYIHSCLLPILLKLYISLLNLLHVPCDTHRELGEQSDGKLIQIGFGNSSNSTQNCSYNTHS